MSGEVASGPAVSWIVAFIETAFPLPSTHTTCGFAATVFHIGWPRAVKSLFSKSRTLAEGVNTSVVLFRRIRKLLPRHARERSSSENRPKSCQNTGEYQYEDGKIHAAPLSAAACA